MKETKTREKILKNVRNGIIEPVSNVFFSTQPSKDFYNIVEEDALISFATEFNKVNGGFVYCAGPEEFEQNFTALVNSRKWEEVYTADPKIAEMLEIIGVKTSSSADEFSNQDAGVTSCEYLIGRTGSIMVSSKQKSGRRMNFFPHNHIVIARTNQVVMTLEEAIKLVYEKYMNKPSMVSVITGPSRTADIEKTLVMGAHGPREIIVFLLDF